jgi:DnaJ-domain-containing protein 1
MSIGKRIIDLARANLNALLDKAAGDTSLDDLTDDELEAELQKRRDRKLREDEERRAAERAAQNARARSQSSTRTSTTPPPRTQPPPRTPKPPPPRAQERKRWAPPPSMPSLGEKRLRELYAQLEVPYGASFEEVKKSFRRLMRKYHPDLHVGNPQKHKTATQLTMSLTQAYNELEQHLTGGRRS